MRNKKIVPIILTVLLAVVIVCIVIGINFGNKNAEQVYESTTENIEAESENSAVDDSTEKEDISTDDDSDTSSASSLKEITDADSTSVSEDSTDSDLENDSQEITSDTVEIELEQSSNQVILVEANGSTAKLTMYERENSDDDFTEVLSTSARIGANGIGKTKEGDRKTPAGEYGFLFAFGNKDNPGTKISYTKVDDSYYWVDDVNSIYYNKFVSTNEVVKDWSSAEHISEVQDSYNYVLALDYNSSCEKGIGSAIFLHCTPTGGAGCIAVDESVMLEILKEIEPDCRIVIQ